MLWLAEQALTDEVCKLCGHRYEECTDPDRDWFPQRHVDYAAMEQAAAVWRYQALHEAAPFHDGSWRAWSKERTAATPYHFLDGVSIYVATTDERPGDDFLTDENAVPWRPSGVENLNQEPEDRGGHDDREGDDPHGVPEVQP